MFISTRVDLIFRPLIPVSHTTQHITLNTRDVSLQGAMFCSHKKASIMRYKLQGKICVEFLVKRMSDNL